ncbi:MAG: ABC transporter ATP-binding protein [Actinomycetota bacterium]|nr:ABC transporter ATP-binding protein [Actinomycetota bacterium]
MSPSGDLAVRGLTVTYRRRPALRAVTFHAPAGSVTGVIGPNGAGKSTLLKAVLGLVRPDTGVVTVGGRPAAAARRRTAYVPQRSMIDWDYPAVVHEVVAMGRYPHLGLLRPRSGEDRRKIDEALDRVGLTEYASRQIGELSGGQQQRVFLARALAQEASLLLLDEPFAGVDALTIALLGTLLRDLAADGACVVVVNHDLSTIDTLCDRLLLLAQRVVAAGPAAAVLTPAALGAAYGAVPAQLAAAMRQPSNGASPTAASG